MSRMILKPESTFLAFTAAASSSLSGCPVANIADYESSQECWRTNNVATESTVTLNFGEADQAVVRLFLNDCNFTAMTVQGHADDESWGSPDFEEAVTLAEEGYTGKYKGNFDLTAFAYQYMRLVIDAATPTDGQAYFRIGNVLALETAAALAINPVYPMPVGAPMPGKSLKFEAWGEDFIYLGVTEQFTCELEWMLKDTQEPAFWSLFRGNMADAWYLSLEGARGLGDQYAFLGRLRMDSEMWLTWEGRKKSKTKAFTFTEVI